MVCSKIRRQPAVLLALLGEAPHDLADARGGDLDAVLRADRLQLVVVRGQLERHGLEAVPRDLTRDA